MTRLLVTADADSDFNDIISYLQQNAGARVAQNYTRRFNATLDGLLLFPQTGSPRPGLGPNVRIAVVSPYILIYDYLARDDTLVLLRILHEKRNITRRLVRRS